MRRQKIKKDSILIALFCGATFLYWFSLYTYVPIILPYSKDLGASNSLLGLIAGSYGFMQLIFRIPMGVFSDKNNNRKILVLLGMLFSLISAVGLFMVKTPAGVLIFRGLSGVAASTWVGFTTLFASYFESIQYAMGLLLAFNSVGTMLATLSGGIISQIHSAYWTFLIAAFVAGFGFLLSLFIKDKNVNGTSKNSINVNQLLAIGKNKTLLFVSLLGLLLQYIVFSTVYGFTTTYAKELKASDFEIGLLTFFSTLPNVISAVLSSWFIKMFGAKKTLELGFIVVGLSTLAIPFSRSILPLYITQTFGGFGSGLIFPTLMTLSVKDIEPEKRTTAMGYFQSIYAIGMFAGPSITGFISEFFGLKIGFYSVFFVSIVSFSVVKMFYSRILRK